MGLIDFDRTKASTILQGSTSGWFSLAKNTYQRHCLCLTTPPPFHILLCIIAKYPITKLFSHTLVIDKNSNCTVDDDPQIQYTVFMGSCYNPEKNTKWPGSCRLHMQYTWGHSHVYFYSWGDRQNLNLEVGTDTNSIRSKHILINNVWKTKTNWGPVTLPVCNTLKYNHKVQARSLKMSQPSVSGKQPECFQVPF